MSASNTRTTFLGNGQAPVVTTMVNGDLETKTQADLVKEQADLTARLARKQHNPAQLTARLSAVEALII